MRKSHPGESLAITGNAAILAVIHTVFGVFVSFLLYYLFDEFDESWQKRSNLYKITDVSVEIMLIATLGYWASDATLLLSPIFPVSKAKEIAVDSWVSGVFFVVALFLFLDGLTEKLKYLQNTFFEDTFSRWLPQYGSLVDLNLSYTPVTKEDKKKAAEPPHARVTTASSHSHVVHSK
jgi:hypothetical protein